MDSIVCCCCKSDMTNYNVNRNTSFELKFIDAKRIIYNIIALLKYWFEGAFKYRVVPWFTLNKFIIHMLECCFIVG